MRTRTSRGTAVGTTLATLGMGLFASGGIALLAPAASAQPGQGNPPGNNGFIQIETEPIDTPDKPDNHPHVDCRFNIEWRNFDSDDGPASVVFNSQPPTGNAVITVVEGSPSVTLEADGKGGRKDLDATELYELSFTGDDPHPQQGFHVKVTSETGDGTKTKVFWVQPCEQPPPTTEPPTTEPPETSEPPEEPEEPEKPEKPDQPERPDKPEGDQPEGDEPEEEPDVPTVVTAGSDSGGPSTVGLGLAASGATLAAIGTGLLVTRRRGDHQA